MDHLKSLIRDVPDFPNPGILFRDITPLLLDPHALREAIDAFAALFRGQAIDRIAAVEARGFILGAPLALALGCGFVPVRKVGKLPRHRATRTYDLEYGTNSLEIHSDSIEPGQNVVIVDDVLATGGTARAATELVRELGGNIVGIAFLLEISFLEGRLSLPGLAVHSLLQY